jgi:hypothetical protein
MKNLEAKREKMLALTAEVGINNNALLEFLKEAIAAKTEICNLYDDEVGMTRVYECRMLVFLLGGSQ